LLKGLEADVAVLLQPERLDAKHLYVGDRQFITRRITRNRANR
jgi:hypothetical protein